MEQTLIALLILSLTTEKIANIIKLQCGAPKPRKNESSDRAKERRAQNCSVFTGIALAFILKINILDLFKTGELDLMWSCIDCLAGKFWHTVGGCLLTGVFLSFGSQFFHDLIAIVYEIKRAKHNLTNLSKLGGEFGSIDSYDKKNMQLELKNFVREKTGEYPQDVKIDYGNNSATVYISEQKGEMLPEDFNYVSPVKKEEVKISIKVEPPKI